MSHNEPGPGELRNRQRRRRMGYYYGSAVVIGLMIGFGISQFDGGVGEVFRAGAPTATLDTVPAIVLALGLFLGLVVLPAWGFTQIDELKREENLIGYTGGTMAVLGGYPIWAVLAAAGLTPAPHALGMFLICMGAMIATFLWARFLR